MNKLSEKLSQLSGDLLNSGWKESPGQFKEHSRCFFKFYPTIIECNLNSKGRGIQICVCVTDYKIREYHLQGVSIDLAGEHKDDSWIKIENYAIKEISLENIEKLIPRLIKSWEAFATYE